MKIIDAVEIHIFGVPGKGALPHTKVEVSGINTIYADTVVLFHVIKNRAQLVDVPVNRLL